MNFHFSFYPFSVLFLDHKITNNHKENDCYNELVQILNCLNNDQVLDQEHVSNQLLDIDPFDNTFLY